MNLRILSLAALSGMLTATGCGGGSPGTGITPNTAGSGGSATIPTSGSKQTLVASFLVPARNVKAATSSSTRKPAYISPGSSGIEVLLGVSTGVVASNMSWVIGTSGHPIPLVGTPGVSFSGNTLTTTQAGYNSSSTAPASISYSYVPSSTAGYYVFTVSMVNLASNAAGTTYEVGVVLTDITNNNYVLSSGQAPAAAAFTLGTTTTQILAPITLSPVLAKAYLTGPSLITSAATAVTGVSGGGGFNGTVGTLPTLTSYELTAFPADELGYVIPQQGGATPTTFLNTSDWGVKSITSLALFMGTYSQTTAGVALTPFTGTTNPLPLNTTFVAPVVAAFTAYPGSLTTGTTSSLSFAGNPGSIATIKAPSGSSPNQAPVASYVTSIVSGQPVNVTKGSAYTLPAAITAYGNFFVVSANTASTSGYVTGYTYTPGVNLPLTGLSNIGTSATVNFTPGIVPVIQ